MADLISDGVSVEELSGPIYEKFNKSFTAFKEGFIKLQPYNQVVPRCFLKYEKRIKDFQTRTDDVWVASFPKCGKFYNLLYNKINLIKSPIAFPIGLQKHVELKKLYVFL